MPLPPSHDTYRQTKFFASLDGLRALSILGVVWTHSWIGTPQDNWLRNIPILRSGPTGVDVFFTISGFLITTLLLREREKFAKISLRDFYIRRALRIWPIYYGVLVLYILLTAITEHDPQRRATFFHFLPTYLTFTYTWFWGAVGGQLAIFNFAWSLSTEEQFYMLWPILLKLLGKIGPVIAMLAIIALRISTDHGLNHFINPEALPFRIIASVSVPICMGALLAHALHWRRGYGALRPLLGLKIAAPISLVLFLASIAPASPAFAPCMWICLPLLIGSCVIREDNGLAPLLRLKPVAFVGVVSYGMYLYNTLVIKATRPALAHIGIHHPVVVFPLVLALTVLVAWLSFKFFESPFLALKNKFSRLRPAPSTQAPLKITSPEIQGPIHP